MSRRPASTYRIQLTPSFGFRRAAEVVPYLHELGITDLYLSPPFAAEPDSQHGYDVVDPNRLRPELGGDEGFRILTDTLRRHKMGLVIDFVPNHMGLSANNAWWNDLLENGPSSVFAPFFDVEWQPVKHELAHKVLIPILGDQFGEVLERGELKLVREGGSFSLIYYQHRFPIAPRAVPFLLLYEIDRLAQELGESDVHLQELRSIVSALEKLAPRHEVDTEKVAERAREKEVAKRRLCALFEASPALCAHVDANVRRFNGQVGDAHSFDLLDELLDRQAYRLAHWRVAGEEINYRRFFDINSLGAIRMEDERVFDETHRLLSQLIDEGVVTGVRIDHPDGLYLPSLYLRRLRERHPSLYIVVEKILEGPERMPSAWPVDGTTGYEFMRTVNGLFVDVSRAKQFDELYARFIGGPLDWNRLVYEKKRALMRSSMASEINLLGQRLNRISERNRRTRDFTLNALTQALSEYVARLPIYRTYVEGRSAREVDERDRMYIESTLTRAKRESRELNRTLYDFLGDILLLKEPTEETLEFVRKLQQVTAPVTAKAIEDTAFYVYNRLISLNEVGSNPLEFGVTTEEFHRRCAERLRRWPGSLNATSTHDTKRSEDVRLRIDALSEIPTEWSAQLTRFAELNRPYKEEVDGQLAPEANDELLLYQTLIGAFPEGADRKGFGARIEAYLEKALREAKVHSSWTNPNEAYEQACKRFAAAILESRVFLDEFVPFVRRIALAARRSSLSLVAIKLIAPGVTDLYQGCELEDLSLVDPDNRRPIDFAHRWRLLREITGRLKEGPLPRAQLAHEVAKDVALADGRAKLLLLREGLRLRREHPRLFQSGSYLPLSLEGPHSSHALAFMRTHEQMSVACVVPRLLIEQAGPLDARVVLPEGTSGPWTELVSGREVVPSHGRLELRDCFAGFPVALLWASSVGQRGNGERAR